MEANNLAIIIAYYFSKFDKQGIKYLGYKTNSEAFQDVANKLGIKKNYVKFRRDEFDPIHPWREGWKRPMAMRIVRTIEALQELSESDLREIVRNILSSKEYRSGDDIKRIVSLFSDKKPIGENKNFVLRGPTGKKAEEYFMAYHKRTSLPVAGELADTREFGCGYDFEINSSQKILIEVKGLAKVEGGILFTNKEWETAQKYQEKYIVALVSNLDNDPKIKFIYNPYKKLGAKKNIITSVQIQWSVPSKQLVDD